MDKQQREAEAAIRQQNWEHGKKRTCLRCAAIFLTRKNKRIHMKLVPNCDET